MSSFNLNGLYMNNTNANKNFSFLNHSRNHLDKDKFEKGTDKYAPFNSYLNDLNKKTEDTVFDNRKIKNVFGKELNMNLSYATTDEGLVMARDSFNDLRDYYKNDLGSLFNKMGELTGTKKNLNGVEISYARSMDTSLPNYIYIKFPNGDELLETSFLRSDDFFEKVDKFINAKNVKNMGIWNDFFENKLYE